MNGGKPVSTTLAEERRTVMGQRIYSGWLGSAAVVFVVALAGCGGGGTPDAASSASTESTEVTETAIDVESTGGGACGELTALATAVGSTLRVTADEAVMAKSDDFRTASSALFEYASRAPEDIKADISGVSDFWDDVAGRLSLLESQSGSPDATLVDIENEHIRETFAHPDFVDSSAQVLAWLDSEAGKCPDSDATDEALGGKQVGEVDDEATAAVNEAMSRRTEEEFGSPPLGAEVRDCRKERDLSENSLLAPGGTAYVCEVWYEGEHVSDGPAAIDAQGSVAVRP
jgi:hypothetical protein